MADTYEKDLAQKSSLTLADYVRVVGSDNVSYKQLLSSFPAPFRTMSETDMPTLLKSLTQGTYFYRIDNVSGFPVTGGVVYRIVKTHAVNDARASIVAVPMNASSPDIYTAFVASASATSISWVKQPTRAEVDAASKVILAKEITQSTSASVTLTAQHTYLVTGAHPFAAGCAYLVAGWASGAARITPILANSNLSLSLNSLTLTASLNANITMWIRVLDLGANS